MNYDSSTLVVRASAGADSDVIVDVTPRTAGWQHLSFQARRLRAGAVFSDATGDEEVGLVILCGTLSVDSTAGAWHDIGRRRSVFDGPPFALYLPRRVRYTVTARTDCEFALARAWTDQDHPARLITPADVPVEIRGGDNATRRINGIIPPGFDCHRLVMVEVYTPGGNWSSYPPHKHDVHRVDAGGRILEADLEETYFYKIDRPEGFAYQRVYTDERSPLQQAGHGFDALVMARDNDVVLVPEGYHPVCSPPGYHTYYLNALAGSAQSLANFEDPRHAWVKDTYRARDPRVTGRLDVGDTA